MDFEGSVAEVFLMEAKDLLSKMESALLKIENGEQSVDYINSIFRSAHTLKGGAAMFEFNELSSFAHEIEDLLSIYRSGNMAINTKQISKLLEAVDCLNILLEESIKKNIKPESILRKQQIIQNLKNAVLGPESSVNNPISGPESTVTILPLNDKAPDLTAIQSQVLITDVEAQIDNNQENNSIGKQKKIVEPMINLAYKSSIINKDHDIKHNKINEDRSVYEENLAELFKTIVKVEANKLDEIINLIGEIVIMQAHLSKLTKENKVSTDYFMDAMERLSNLIDDLRNLSLKLRMLPINESFSRFSRVVRDIATQKNKQIKLQIKGGDTELDKSIIEKINEPLLHLVRNACDHGIDLPEMRISLGKDPCGEVTLEAIQENGEVIIKASDDGQGINIEKVKQHAINMKLLDPNNNPTEQEIIACIFQPGFSTADEVTTLSGRGVGMDVVKKEVEKLHGSIQIYTGLNQGTTIALRLPLTLAIIDGLLIKVKDFLFVVPMWNVLECIQINKQEYQSILNNNHMQFRNKILPGIILNNLLGGGEVAHEFNNAIIVQQADFKVAVIIDALIGEIQTVIKPMPEMFAKLKWINGATILGDGRIAVILDVTGLISEVINKQKKL